ncbi:hypothetical protein LX36DRAFT_438071 [Colletotrichum falcatum]|nr:hypothetical protein LX36DRAFT_438071 [Colletotrichum falcatum]
MSHVTRQREWNSGENAVWQCQGWNRLVCYVVAQDLGILEFVNTGGPGHVSVIGSASISPGAVESRYIVRARFSFSSPGNIKALFRVEMTVTLDGAAGEMSRHDGISHRRKRYPQKNNVRPAPTHPPPHLRLRHTHCRCGIHPYFTARCPSLLAAIPTPPKLFWRPQAQRHQRSPQRPTSYRLSVVAVLYQAHILRLRRT